MNGSLANVKVHLDGLEGLVKSVGGLQALVKTPFIFKYSCWYVKPESWERDPVNFSLRIKNNQGRYFFCDSFGLKTTLRTSQPSSPISSSRH
jgi:hypothetical protein